jgi:hypothetical protein
MFESQYTNFQNGMHDAKMVGKYIDKRCMINKLIFYVFFIS